MNALLHKLFTTFSINHGVSIDSRGVKPGDIFFGIRGENFDGNRFAEKALEQGAVYAVIDNPDYQIDERCLLTENALDMLQALANKYRKQFAIPFLAITGSNGKTTTKELTNAVLSKKYKTHATKGNLNNHLGVPLTMLTIPSNTQFAVIEMGANHIGEIARLCEIVEPTHGLITNIGKAHLEGFGSFQGVIKAKTELYRYLEKTGRKIFIDSENEILMKYGANIKQITYSLNKDADTTCRLITETPFLKLNWNRKKQKEIVKSNLIGRYNAQNICAAIAVGAYFNVNPVSIIEAVENYQAYTNRSQLIDTKNNNRLILDAYNANPSSMKVALENLSDMAARRKTKTVILGDMMELGDEAIKEHRAILNKLEELDIERVILVGQTFRKAITDNRHQSFSTIEELVQWLKNQSIKEHLFLIKGSRGMQLERITRYL